VAYDHASHVASRSGRVAARPPVAWAPPGLGNATPAVCRRLYRDMRQRFPGVRQGKPHPATACRCASATSSRPCDNAVAACHSVTRRLPQCHPALVTASPRTSVHAAGPRRNVTFGARQCGVAGRQRRISRAGTWRRRGGASHRRDGNVASDRRGVARRMPRRRKRRTGAWRGGGSAWQGVSGPSRAAGIDASLRRGLVTTFGFRSPGPRQLAAAGLPFVYKVADLRVFGFVRLSAVWGCWRAHRPVPVRELSLLLLPRAPVVCTATGNINRRCRRVAGGWTDPDW